MERKKYVIGLDFGTLSCRAILADTGTGEIAAQATSEYAHGVMDEFLPDGSTRLPAEWALQHPQDYLDALKTTIPSVLRESGIPSKDVIGISIDFTACTILPLDRQGKPLCFYDEFKHRPHAYVKLWKHHGAQKQTEQINTLLKEQGKIGLPRYGGKVSSELMLPKVLQILQEDAELYARADKIMEAADWLCFLLSGVDRRSICFAGYKAMWHHAEGYPSESLLKALDPRLEQFAHEKLSGDICPAGGRYGVLNEDWAKRLGLLPGTVIGCSVIDSHAGIPGCGITKPGQMMLMLGTSSVQAVLSEQPYSGQGIIGGVKNGTVPGYYVWESGLAAVGDMLSWFVTNHVSAAYQQEAKAQGMGIYAYLRRLACNIMPGESGLIALDWWNGNKTPFVDVDLSGLLLGYTLSVKPEEIYRALIEATGFGTRVIMEAFQKGGVLIDTIIACGGIARKDPLLLQIYADILNREIKVSASDQTAALGAAMYASAAAEKAAGGHGSVVEAAGAMSRIQKETYRPIAKHVAIYNTLYREYKTLGDYFGRQSAIMKTLKRIRINAKEKDRR